MFFKIDPDMWNKGTFFVKVNLILKDKDDESLPKFYFNDQKFTPRMSVPRFILEKRCTI